MKREIKIFFSFISVLLIGLFVVGCNHPHTYSDDWTYNETYHWHSSTCEHKDEIKGKEAHSFTEWIIDEEPTEQKHGQKSRECTVCGYKQIEDIDKIIHTHTFSDEWSYDDLKHWHSSTCNHDLKADEGNHEWNEWEIIKEESYLEDGLKKTSCKVCGKEKEETIPQRTYMTSSEFKSLVIDKINKNSGTVSYKKNDLEAKVQFDNNLVKLINEDVTIYQVKDEKLYSISKLNDTWFAKEEDITSKVYTDLIDNISVNKVLDYLFESDKSIVDLLKSDFVTYTYNSETGLYQVSISDDLDKTNLDKLEEFVSHIQYSKYEAESLTFGIKNEEGEAIEELNINSDGDITLPEKIYNLAFTQDGEDGHYHMSYNGNNEEKFGHEEHHYGDLIVDIAPSEDELGNEIDGLGHKVCSTCGYVKENIVIPHEAHVHDWGEYDISVKPSYDGTGKYLRVCKKNKSHEDYIILPTLTDQRYIKEYELNNDKVIEKVSYDLVLEDNEKKTISFENEYAILSINDSLNACAIRGIIYYDLDDYYLLDELNSDTALKLNNLELNNEIINFDEIILFGIKTSSGFDVIDIIDFKHPNYKIIFDDNLKVNVNGKEYKEDETNLVNGNEYEFEITLNSNEKTIYSVTYLNAKSNDKIEVSNSNGKYLITIIGDTQIFVTTAYIYNELTNSSILDFDNYQYDIIILGPEGTNEYYMFDGALEKSKLTASGNILKINDNAVIFKINDNKVILKEELLNSTFIIDKALNDKYILKTKNGLYIGTNSTKSGSLSASDKDVYYSLLSFENNKIKINFGENILEYNTGSDVFKYYTGTQKQVEVFYRINKEYTNEEKTERMNFLTDLELNYVKSLFDKSYIVLENPLNIEIDSKKVALSIEDDGDTRATVLNNVLTIPVQEHTVDKIIKIKLTTDSKEEIISISIPKVESKTAKEAYDLINSFEANNQYSDSLYFVSGIVKTITEKNNKYTIDIYSESNSDEIITVYNALSTIDKIYVGDTITAVGYLQKYIKDNNVVPEVVAHNNVNVQVLSRTAGDAVVAFNIPSEYDDKVHIYVDSTEVFMPVIGKNGNELKFRIEVTNLEVKSVKIGENLVKKVNDIYTVTFDNSQEITIELAETFTKTVLAALKSVNNSTCDSTGGTLTKTYRGGGTGKTYLKDASSGTSEIKILSKTAYSISDSATKLYFLINLGAGSASKDRGYTTVSLLDFEGNIISETTLNITKDYTKEPTEYIVSWDLDNTLKSSIYGVKVQHDKVSGWNSNLYSFELYTN